MAPGESEVESTTDGIINFAVGLPTDFDRELFKCLVLETQNISREQFENVCILIGSRIMDHGLERLKIAEMSK